MPRTHDPSPPKAGPGMVFGKTLSGKRGRLKKRNSGNNNNNNKSLLSLTNDAAAQLVNDDEFCFQDTRTMMKTSKQQSASNKSRVFQESSSDEDEEMEDAVAGPHKNKTQEQPASVVVASTKATTMTEASSKKTKTSNASNNNNNSISKRKKKQAITLTAPAIKSKNKAGSNNSKKATTATTTKKSTKARSTTPTFQTMATNILTPITNANSKQRRPAVTVQKQASTSSSSPRAVPPTKVAPPPSLPPPQPVFHNRCAIGFDTRFLETVQGKTTGQELVRECHAFLEALAVRGATPCIVATSVAKEKTTTVIHRRRNAIAVQTWSSSSSSQDTTVEESIAPTWIAPPINNSNKINRKAVHVPKPLSANDSWKHFGEMVEAIIEEDAKQGQLVISRSSNNKKKRQPLDITLVSNDMSLFCDINEASHKRAIARFWDLVKPFFQDSTLRSIHIVMAKTGTIALAKPPEPEDNDADKIKSPSGGDQDQDSTTMEEEESDARSRHEIAIANCIRTLQDQLLARSEDGFNKNVLSTPVDVTFSMVDATAHPRLGFRTLLRRCLRDIVSSMTAHYSTHTLDMGQPQSLIHLELPEDMDSTQCSVSLEVTYKTLPFALDKPTVTEGFFADLHELAHSRFDIIQLVPLSCVDASLLFGIPMSVQAAVEGDFEQYQEALVLVRSLFRVMQEREVAMLLRIHDEQQPSDGNSEVIETATSTTSMSGGIFHNAKRGQHLLLMAEEVVAGDSPPSTGILFRYASADEMILEQDKPFSKMDTSLSEEVTKQYETYIDNVFDSLDCNAVNPLYLDVISTPPPTLERLSLSNCSPSMDDYDKQWNDRVGVGALAARNSTMEMESGPLSTNQNETGLDGDDDDDEDNLFAFDYS